MTGAELRSHRRAAGLSQQALAERAGVSRDAVQYWERKAQLDLRGYAPRRFFEVLGLRVFSTPNARAGGWGLTPSDPMQERLDAGARAERARLQGREAERTARARVVCGARTRKGTTCRNKSEPGRKRCRFHGGKSTGPRTPEGRARIAEAQRRRWARWRAEQSETAEAIEAGAARWGGGGPNSAMLHRERSAAAAPVIANPRFSRVRARKGPSVL